MSGGLVLEFGWEGDAGVGEKSIEDTVAGRKTASCIFRADCGPEDLALLSNARGQEVPVLDQAGRCRCRIRVLDVFETAFGDPDSRAVAGETAGDVTRFHADHRKAWIATRPGERLRDDEILIVVVYALVADV